MKISPISSLPLFLAGMAILPTIVLQSSILLLLLQMLILALGAWRAGKHIRPLYYLLLISSVTLFHLLSPFGEVLYTIGRFTITDGALILGLRKGLVVSALVFCSLATVRKELQLPGQFGRLLSQLFSNLELLMAHKNNLQRKNLLQSIDTLLLNLLQQPPHQRPSSSRERRWQGWHMACLLALFHWLLALSPRWLDLPW